MLLLLLMLFHKIHIKSITSIKIHRLARPNYNLIWLLNEEIDSASFASFESWFQSIAPRNLKLLFGYIPLFRLGSVRSVALLMVDGN